MTFQEKLTRLTRNMNLSSIARDIGISPSTLSNFMTGRHSPRMTTLIALANGLEVDVKWLIDPAAGWPPVRVEQSQTEPAPVA